MLVENKILLCIVLSILLINGLLLYLKVFKRAFYIQLVILVFCFLLESAFSFIVPTKEKPNEFIELYWKTELSGLDYYYGHKLIPNRSTRHRRECDDSLVFDVQYSVNEYGLRNLSFYSEKEHIMLFGAKQVFGIGLNDNETISHQLSIINDSVSVYNYGLLHSPFTFLMTVLDSNFVEIGNEKGTIYYWITDQDIQSLSATRSYLELRSDKAPFYKVSGDSFIHASNIFEGRSLITGLYHLMNKSATTRFIEPVFQSRESQIRKLVKAYEHALRLYKRNYHYSNEIIFIVEESKHWELGFDKPTKDQVISALLENNIPFIDLNIQSEFGVFSKAYATYMAKTINKHQQMLE